MTRRRTGMVLGSIALVAALLTGCGSGSPPRAEVLADLAEQVVVPAFEDLQARTGALADAAGRLCDDPSADRLDEARSALIEARAAWSYSEAMWAGPVTERRSWALIDWPISTEQIEELIADSGIELDYERLSRRIGADQRGLGAIEYMLGSPDAGPGALEALRDPRRCSYVAGVADVIADEAALLLDDWAVDFDGGGPYRRIFADPDGMGLDSVVNDSLFLLEDMADLELYLAVWSAERDAGLDVVDEGPMGLAVSDLHWHLQGLRHMLIGSGASGGGNAGAAGLGPLLGDDLSVRLAGQFDEAARLVAALDSPLRAAVVDDPEAATAASDAVKAVQITVATEIVSRLGVTIGFSDADGDTGL